MQLFITYLFLKKCKSLHFNLQKMISAWKQLNKNNLKCDFEVFLSGCLVENCGYKKWFVWICDLLKFPFPQLKNTIHLR